MLKLNWHCLNFLIFLLYLSIFSWKDKLDCNNHSLVLMELIIEFENNETRKFNATNDAIANASDL